MQWNPIARFNQTRISFPPLVGAHSRISTICATPDLLIAGGFYGELVMRSTVFLSEQEEEQAVDIFHIRRLTNDDNGITNHITTYHPEIREKFLISSNDHYVRLYDAQEDNIIPLIKRPIPINAAKMCPNGKMLALASDQEIVEIVDPKSEQVVKTLAGHIGFSFSTDWHSDGNILAVGNEDHTCRIYDVRIDRCLHVLGSHMSPVRCVKFSPDMQALAVMEESDFVTFYDVPRNCEYSTTLDFFGETSGLDFAMEGRFCYFGCAEPGLGGVIELQRPQVSWLDGLLL